MAKQQITDFFQLQKDINSNSLKPIYLLYGEESYLHNIIQDNIKAHFRNGKESVNYEIFYGENIDFNRLINSIKILPLGTEKQVIILKHLEKLSDSYAKKLDFLIKSKSFQDDSVIILIFSLNKKIPTNISLERIKKYGSIVSLKKPKSYQIKQWANQKCRENNLNILPEALYYLQRLTDNDLGRIDNELEKISCYLGKNSSMIKREDIINNFFGSEEVNIFNFVDAIGERKTKLALKLLEKLAENEYHPLSLLAMISRQIKLILRAKLYYGNQEKLKGELHLPPFVIDKLIQQSHKYKLEKLKNIFRHLLDAERKLKTGYFNPVLVLEQLVIEITN
ncbi:MAG: DNA polymerase III subunit delta [Atribacterota bacterium]